MTPLTLTFYRSGIARRWRWRLVHSNGQKIAREAQALGFSRLVDAERNACVTLGGPHASLAARGLPEVHLAERPDVTVAYDATE